MICKGEYIVKKELKATGLILLVAAMLTAGGCGGGFSYNSEIAPEIERGKYSTFEIIQRDHRTLGAEVSRMLETMVEDELIRKGYEKTDPGQGSVKVMINALLDQSIDSSAYGRGYKEQTGEFPITKEGTIHVLLYDAATSAWMWRGEVNGLTKYENPGTSKESKSSLRKVMAKMLSEIPERK
jgi:hypothetical protein